MPVLFTAHGSLTQSHAIERYVGRLTGLYPEDIWEAAKCDEVVDMAEDLNKRISMCLHKVPEFKAHSRSALATEYGPFWLGKMEQMLSSPSKWAGDRLWRVQALHGLLDLLLLLDSGLRPGLEVGLDAASREGSANASPIKLRSSGSTISSSRTPPMLNKAGCFRP